MNKKPLLTVAALVAGIVFTVDTVAADEGAYVSLMIGNASLGDSTISAKRDDLTASVDAAQLEDSSMLLGGAVGYDFGNGFRLEADVTHQNYDVEKLLGTDKNSKTLAAATGDIDAISFGVNAVYDIKIDELPVTPYVGAGVGAVFLNANDVKASGRTKMSDSAYAPTGVLMAGLGFGLTDSVVLSAGYRLQGIATQDGSRTRKTNNDGSAKKSGETLDVLLIHSGIVGISYKF